MNCLLLFPLALVALAFPLAPSQAQDEGERLVPRFLPGKAYVYASETSLRMEMPSSDGSSPGERRVDMAYEALLVASARTAGEGAAIDASTRRLRFSVRAGEQAIDYDSADESTKGTPLALHFENGRQRGLALEIDGVPKVVSAKETGGGGPATPMPGMPQFGPEELRQLVAGLLQGFSPDPIKPGAEWVQKGKRSLGQFGEMDFEITYRYAGDETIDGAECAVITFSGDMKGDVAVSDPSSGTGRGRLGFEGTGLEGRLVFDKARGAVKESRQAVSMNIDMPAQNPLAPGAVRLPVRQEVVVRLLSLDDA